MSRPTERQLTGVISSILGESATPAPRLDHPEKWDAHWLLVSGWELALEVEEGQRHPCTNVAKYWAWLERNPSRRLALVHVYFPTSRALDDKRDLLGRFLAEKMVSALPGRFSYFRVTLRSLADALEDLTEVIRQAGDCR